MAKKNVKYTKEQIDEEQTKVLDRITESILFNQMALNKLHEVRYTQYFEKDLKHALNRAQKELVKAEKKHFDSFFDLLQESTQGLLKVQEDLVKEITSFGLEEYENITNLLQSFRDYPEDFEKLINEIIEREQKTESK